MITLWNSNNNSNNIFDGRTLRLQQQEITQHTRGTSQTTFKYLTFSHTLPFKLHELVLTFHRLPFYHGGGGEFPWKINKRKFQYIYVYSHSVTEELWKNLLKI